MEPPPGKFAFLTFVGGTTSETAHCCFRELHREEQKSYVPKKNLTGCNLVF